MERFDSIKNHLTAKGYGLIGTGSKRAAYLSPNKSHVIKIPINEIGIMENIMEYREYRRRDNPNLARCAITFEHLIIMDYVQPAKGELLPEWCDRFDNQVGYDRKGNLVAYDYGF